METQSHEDWISDAVRRFNRPLAQYAWHLLGDADRARDVVQDTFLRLCAQKRERLDGRLEPWLFTVCRNRAMDVLRKEKRMIPLTEAHDAALAERPEPTPAWAADDAPPLAQALERLPANQREVIRLKFLHNMSYRDISRVTGLTQNHVGVLIHNGILTLRRRLAGASTEGSLT